MINETSMWWKPQASLLQLFVLISIWMTESWVKGAYTPCVYTWECSTSCCALAYSDTNVLGYYWLDSTLCNGSGLVSGQSCSGPSSWSSQWWEDTICQSKEYCFEKYVLPFVIIFCIVAAFIIGALIVFLVFWCKRRRAEKKKQKQTEIANATEKEDDEVKNSQIDGNFNEKGHNETTAMGLKGDGSRLSNHPADNSKQEEHFSGEEEKEQQISEHESIENQPVQFHATAVI